MGSEKIPSNPAGAVLDLYFNPPDAKMVSPVIQPDSSEARNAAIGAISLGLPRRPSGVEATNCLSRSEPTRPASHLVLSDRRVDLVEEGFDIAIRMGPQVDSGLVARKITNAPIFVCASPSYLKKHGIPKSPQMLATHNCLTYSYSRQETDWPFTRDALEKTVQVSGSLRANNGSVLVNAAIEGLGIIRQPRFLVSEALSRKQLVRVLPAWSAGEHAVYTVYPS